MTEAMERLYLALSKYGTVQLLKEGYVFTVLITGSGLSNSGTVDDLNQLIVRSAPAYRHIEAMKNEDAFYCLVLKP